MDDSVTRLDKNEDLALEMRDLTELHCARNFLRSKGDFQRRQHRSSRLRSRLAWRISGLIHGVWGLWTTDDSIIIIIINTVFIRRQYVVYVGKSLD